MMTVNKFLSVTKMAPTVYETETCKGVATLKRSRQEQPGPVGKIITSPACTHTASVSETTSALGWVRKLIKNCHWLALMYRSHQLSIPNYMLIALTEQQ